MSNGPLVVAIYVPLRLYEEAEGNGPESEAAKKSLDCYAEMATGIAEGKRNHIMLPSSCDTHGNREYGIEILVNWTEIAMQASNKDAS